MAKTLIKYKQLDLVGKIVDADIADDAAIATSKLAEGSLFAKTNITNTFTADQNLDSNKITNLADGTVASDAINYGQLSDVQNTLQIEIDNINTALTEGLKTPIPFDASVGGTFPSHDAGTTMKVTVAGTVSGVQLEIGDTIIYDTTGTTPYVVQSNLTQATETVAGFMKIATQALVTAGTDDTTAVTPLKLATRLTAFQTSLLSATDGRYVRYDASQSLTTGQKTQARTNIGAADDSTVVHKTGAETIADVKTFSSSPIVPTPTNPTDAANKAYVDAQISSSTLANLVIREVPTGTINGTNTTFTLADTPVTGKEEVYLNGQLLQSGAGADYTISGDTITMADAPDSAGTVPDVLLVTYVKS